MSLSCYVRHPILYLPLGRKMVEKDYDIKEKKIKIKQIEGKRKKERVI